MNGGQRVFVIDDDLAVRSSLRMLLESAGLTVSDFPDAESFLAQCDQTSCGCVISDIQMPGCSGLELQAKLEERSIALPLIMLTGHADVPAAVQSLKAGAVDFLEKPFDPARLLQQVRLALEIDAARQADLVLEANRLALLERLTPRELQVLSLVTQGISNKAVALDLGISERTVELHRGRGMKKLEVRTLPELVRLMPPDLPG